MATSIIHYISVLLGAILRVSFYTLYERHLLSSSHIRKGPEVTGTWGLLQPFSDATKLLTKEITQPSKSNYWLYIVSPTVILIGRLCLWAVLPYFRLVYSFKFMVIAILLLTTVSVYAHLGCGWASNRSYALLGSLRCVAQSLSYEVSMRFIIISICLCVASVDIKEFHKQMLTLYSIVLSWPILLAWCLSAIAETNRRPYDFAEGESELVSGFNVEYGSVWFTFMFLAEYSNMIFMTVLTCVLFSSGRTVSYSTVAMVPILMMAYVWVRCRFPRTRYDKLMYVCWLVMLPVVLLWTVWVASVSL